MLLGHRSLEGQATEEVLLRFGERMGEARERYQEFIAAGVDEGEREELVGGGLRRRLALQGKIEEKESYDERILGSGEFVDRLWEQESLRHRLRPNVTLPRLVERAARAFDLPPPAIR